MARKIKIRKFIIDTSGVLAQTAAKRHRSSTAAVPEQCAKCRFYSERTKCRAFPEGIPKPILNGSHDHRKPYTNDRGFRFDPAP